MKMHFDSFSNWYKADFEESCLLPVDLQKLISDKILLESWPELFVELKQNPTQTLSCIALAMHNFIIQNSGPELAEFYQQRKIYVM